MTRNSFIQRLIKYWVAVTSLPIVYAFGKYIIPPKSPEVGLMKFPAGKRSTYSPGTTRLIKEGKTVLFVRETSSGQIKSFSAKCTHLGCIVELQEDQELIRCNCHGSIFDLDGNNISGPAPKPLQPYRVEIRDDEVIVSSL